MIPDTTQSHVMETPTAAAAALGGTHAVAGGRAGCPLSILLLCDDSRAHANTVREHIAAFTTRSRHQIKIFNPRGLTGSRFLDLDAFDAVVIHYSLVITSDHYLAPGFREQIRRFSGLKIQLIQDEYRWVEEITGMMRHLGIQVLWTLLPPGEIAKVYGARLPGVRIIPTLGGYVPEDTLGVVPLPLEARPIDIGYRGRTLPYWLGRLAQEKIWIAQGVLARAAEHGLRCDIRWREEDRIYGRRWYRFLASCKATLGTESGASITDFDGSVERRTLAYLAEQPQADFESVSKAVLEFYEGNVKLQVISPRVFEAAALRTALILFPGEYSGIVQPWVHYIPLAKDFSNMEEVARCLRDLPFLRKLTDRAHRDLIASGLYSHRRFISRFDEVLEEEEPVRREGDLRGYWLARIERPLALTGARLVNLARPVLRIPVALFKAMTAAVLLLRQHAGRSLVAHWLSDRALRKETGIVSLLRDALKLALVVQGLRAASGTEGPFRVTVDVDPEHGRALFRSQRLGDRDSRTAAVAAPCTGRLSDLWGGSACPVRSLIWDHSAVRGQAALALPWGIRLLVFVGEHNVHRFDALSMLGVRHPDCVSELLRGFLSDQSPATPEA